MGNIQKSEQALTATNIRVFSFEAHAVRTIIKDGEPWWVLKDVCDVLGLSNPSKVAERLDDDEKSKIDPKSELGSRSNEPITVISESGIYSVVLRSDKPEAKRFKKWVTSEVLPQIRKTGSYIVPKSPHEMVLESMQYLLSEVEKERSLRLAAETKIAANAGKVDFADQLLCSRHGIEIGSFAKILHDNGLDIGRTRLFQLLRQDGYLMNNNEPYQKWKDRGFFEVIESCYSRPGGEQYPYIKTLVTPAGQKRLLEKYRNCTEKKETKKIQRKVPDKITYDLPPDTEFLSTLQPFCDF